MTNQPTAAECSTEAAATAGMETLETRGTTYRVYEYLEVCIHMGRCHGIPTHMTRFHTQNDSDTPPHSNSQWYTTYDMFERKTCLQNKIIKN